MGPRQRKSLCKRFAPPCPKGGTEGAQRLSALCVVFYMEILFLAQMGWRVCVVGYVGELPLFFVYLWVDVLGWFRCWVSWVGVVGIYS